jgi:hypothetical protein
MVAKTAYSVVVGAPSITVGGREKNQSSPVNYEIAAQLRSGFGNTLTSAVPTIVGTGLGLALMAMARLAWAEEWPERRLLIAFRGKSSTARYLTALNIMALSFGMFATIVSA